jgi:hypothetical protein
MKKKLFLGLASLAVVAIAVVATITNVNSTPKLSDLMLENLEVLTQNESQTKVKYVDVGTRTVIDDQGNSVTRQWCECTGEGTLDCPC